MAAVRGQLAGGGESVLWVAVEGCGQQQTVGVFSLRWLGRTRRVMHAGVCRVSTERGGGSCACTLVACTSSPAARAVA